MSSVDVRVGEAAWSAAVDDQQAAYSRAERWLPVLAEGCLLAVDVALVLAAFLIAYWLRFVVPDHEAVALGLGHYVGMGLMVGLLTAMLFGLHGFYDPDHPRPWPARLHTIVSSLSTALVVAVAVSYFLGEQSFSRLWFASGWAIAVVWLTLWRKLAQRLYTTLRDAVAPGNRVLIVGANPLGQQLARELAHRYQVVGYADNGSDLPVDLEGELLGPIAELERLVHAYAVDELVIALPGQRREQVNRLISRGFRRRVQVKYLPDIDAPHIDAPLPHRLQLHHIGGRPYIGYAPVAKVSWLKRASDLVLTGLGLLVLSPLLLAVAAAIKLDSPGPVLFRQRRVGKDGRLFWIYKFRSMRVDADQLLDALRARNEATGPLFKMRDDPRVTRVGRFIRRWSVDELPQLFNVLRGDMSLIGPRPPIPAEVALYEDWQHGRLRAQPGLTGLWQVSGRSDVPFHDMVRLDLHYISSWSLALDVEILLRTVPAVLSNRGAY